MFRLCISIVIIFATIQMHFNNKLVNKNTLYIVCVVCGLCCIIYFVCFRRMTYQLYLQKVDDKNERLLLRATVLNKHVLFMVDTGHAGPPVLNRKYLAVQDANINDIVEDYENTMRKLQSITEYDEYMAMNQLVSTHGCLQYTSGCTMKLAGIGSVEERRGDLLLCPRLQIKTTLGLYDSSKKLETGQVFITHSSKESVHILTSDFLLHNSPCIISHENQTLHLNVHVLELVFLKKSFQTIPYDFNGGAFVITMLVENEPFRLTVDTGTPGPISIGENAVHKIKGFSYQNSKGVLKQQGVNDSIIHSNVLQLNVHFCDSDYNVPCFINNVSPPDVDGYVGLGFLRAFDILIDTHGIGFSKNKLNFTPIESYI